MSSLALICSNCFFSKPGSVSKWLLIWLQWQQNVGISLIDFAKFLLLDLIKISFQPPHVDDKELIIEAKCLETLPCFSSTTKLNNSCDQICRGFPHKKQFPISPGTPGGCPTIQCSSDTTNLELRVRSHRVNVQSHNTAAPAITEANCNPSC